MLAISGLARVMRELPDSQFGGYAAGLWESDIANWLCWKVELPGSPPDKYTALSWSWASLNTKVTFESFWDSECLVKLIGVELSCFPDVYGEIGDGWIVLSGYLKPIQLRQTEFMNEVKVVGPQGEPLPFLRDTDVSHHVYMDAKPALLESPSEVFYCLPLKRNNYSVVYVYCLLLKGYQYNSTSPNRPRSSKLARPKLRAFERVGLLEICFPGREALKKFLGWISEKPLETEIVIR
ncbi:uncharacterized protein F4822DRAFT_441163 [Hypoxylon trugodes]|uniref:uncharacterized protein n=1 Tax=Hypoxylon trugodes TaxID=326681 RepID=UPI00219CBAE5|nr:uncharacterized protein F4822DRAFT_441163 [Hypoxylon trugodes]KAI1391984.1 hypothetical protein F4822DRAFT_441163 [Hypoxylon trugodes]